MLVQKIMNIEELIRYGMILNDFMIMYCLINIGCVFQWY